MTALHERLQGLATLLRADGDEWGAYDLLNEAATALQSSPAQPSDAKDAARWRMANRQRYITYENVLRIEAAIDAAAAPAPIEQEG